ncbi:FAD/NAD-P-binding domain-containing protein [Trametopsis cervina]|nr:FAD/NAD-P-binding domain-containing protein [Trametopsis cervina]
MRTLSFVALAACLSGVVAYPGEVVLNDLFEDPQQRVHDGSRWTVFPHKIKRVAVVGAGPAGLQAAAALIDRNFTVRLFDRAPGPGGNWLYSEEVPVRESYPDIPIDRKRWIPKTLPATKYYNEGDEGLSLDYRWREHWQPRSIWNSLHTNSPAVITGLDEVPYPPDHTWVISAHTIGAHVRAYATIKRLNANDNSSVTSYSTRVEEIAKHGDKWTLTLRHLKRLEEPDRLKATYWTEEFDAVVIGNGPYDIPHVPEIDGLVQWSKVPSSEAPAGFSVYHSRVYRNPERYSGKNVLVVGVGTSGSEIARDIGPYAKKLYVSHKKYDWEKLNPFQRRSFRRFPEETEFVPQIAAFEPLASLSHGIKDGKIKLTNGSLLTGIDEIILATGYNNTNPFLHKILKDIPGNPPRSLAPPAPDVFNRGTWPSVHWTGHYIPDPTIAFTTVRPWTLGKVQSYGFAKVWEGTARIPNEATLWEQYNSTRYHNFRGLFGTGPPHALERQFIAWLNSESLEFGGRLVAPPPLENREVFVYYANQGWEKDFITSKNFTDFENLPASQWSSGESLLDALGTEDDFW